MPDREQALRGAEEELRLALDTTIMDATRQAVQGDQVEGHSAQSEGYSGAHGWAGEQTASGHFFWMMSVPGLFLDRSPPQTAFHGVEESV
jgi:hypothetical protein